MAEQDPEDLDWAEVQQRKPAGRIFKETLTDTKAAFWSTLDDPDSLAEIEENVLIDGILGGFVPPPSLYEEEGVGFGVAKSGEEDYDEAFVLVITDALENPSMNIADLASAIWISRQGYNGNHVAKAEILLVKTAICKYLLAKIKSAGEIKSLATVAELIQVSERFHLSESYPEAFGTARATLARLEGEAHKLAEEHRPSHNNKYELVIRELSKDIYGEDIKGLQEQAGKLMKSVWKTLEEHMEVAKTCKSSLEKLEKESESHSKLAQLNINMEKLKDISFQEEQLKYAREKTERIAKNREIAKLKVQMTKIKKQVNEQTQIKEKLEVEAGEQLREVMKKTEEETASFVSQFLKDEYETKLKLQQETFEKEKEAALTALREELTMSKNNEIDSLKSENEKSMEAFRSEMMQKDAIRSKEIARLSEENKGLTAELAKIKQERKIQQLFGSDGVAASSPVQNSGRGSSSSSNRRTGSIFRR